MTWIGTAHDHGFSQISEIFTDLNIEPKLFLPLFDMVSVKKKEEIGAKEEVAKQLKT